FILRGLSGFVQPGCTIKLVSLPAGELGQIGRLGPADFFQLAVNLPWQPLMNGHQVVGLASGLREPELQKIIKGLQPLQPPVLSSPYFAEIAPELNKAGVALVV